MIKNNDVKNQILLGAIWLVMILFVNPIGSFPLNDDWAYCKDVQIFLETGRIKIINWSAMTLISQIYLGAGWCKIFGFSFTSLRFLTLFIAFVAILFTYHGIKNLTKNSKAALLVALTIACNPLYMSLSNSFMTDIYFFAFSIVSYYFFNRCFENLKYNDLFLATFFALLATMTRQIGIVIPIAYLLTILISPKQRILKYYLINAFPLVIVATALALFNIWVKAEQKDLETYVSASSTLSMLSKPNINRLYSRIGSSGLLLGLFLFPILLFQIKKMFSKAFWQEHKKIIIITILFSLPLIKGFKSFPLGNVFYGLGLGPRLLRDVYFLNLNNEWLFDNITKISLYILGFIGALIAFNSLLINMFVAKNQENNGLNRHKIFYMFLICGYFATFIIPEFFFDRYLIQLCLPLMYLCILNINTFSQRLFNISLVWIFVYFLFSNLLIRDYFVWNKAKWGALTFLTKEMNISPREIDGGFEFNGWFLATAEPPIKADGSNSDKSWWFVDRDTYLLSFNEIPNYSVVKRLGYTQLLPYKQQFIYINKKNNE